MAIDSTDDDSVVREGHHVVVEVNGDKFSFIRVRQGGTVHIAGCAVPTDPLLGAAYGSAFLVGTDRKFEPTSTNPLEQFHEATETERTNVGIIAAETTQLSHGEVERLKAERGGEGVIAALQAASSSFAAKTEFSQEKWRMKKTKKYLLYVVVRRPCASLICEVYFRTAPLRVFNLRPDTLAIMAHAANVGPNADILCVDATGGLVAAAAAERMSGLGTLCCAHVEAKRYALDAPRMLNMPRWLARCARHVPLADLLSAAAAQDAAAATGSAEALRVGGPAGAENGHGCADALRTGDPSADASDRGGSGGGEGRLRAARSPSGEAADAVAPSCVGERGAEPGTRSTEPASDHSSAAPRRVSDAAATATEASELAAPRPLPRTLQQQQRVLRLHEEAAPGTRVPEAILPAIDADLAIIARRGFSAALVAAPRLDYAALAPLLLPLLRPSAAIVLFSPTPQPLAEAYMALHASKEVISLQLQEPWLREVQVLPARTHPTMSTAGTGGFLLTGLRVMHPSGDRVPAAAARGASDPAAAPAAKRRRRGR